MSIVGRLNRTAALPLVLLIRILVGWMFVST
jgi:hypothetical protein